jgi:hypothetical protein
MNFFHRLVPSLTLLLLAPLSVTAEGPEVIKVELKNPLKFENLTDLFEAILSVVMVLATPVIVFFIIYAGFLYVTARGNAQQVEQATKALTYAIIGGVIVLGSFALITIIDNLVTAFIN